MDETGSFNGALIRNFQRTTQNMKFSIKDIFSKSDQIHRKLRIWSHLLNKSLMENFIFCAVTCMKNFQPYCRKLFWTFSDVNELFPSNFVPVIFLQTES